MNSFLSTFRGPFRAGTFGTDEEGSVYDADNRQVVSLTLATNDRGAAPDAPRRARQRRTEELAALLNPPAVDPWEEDATFPVADWQDEVARDETRRGYRDWVEARIEDALEQKEMAFRGEADAELIEEIDPPAA